jgi:hypothetical protein
MKALLLVGFLFGASAPVCPAESSGFAIDLVTPSRAILHLDGAWQHDAECLQVTVSVQEEVSNAALKAYFYGADRTLLYTADRPTLQGSGKSSTIKTPTQFEKGQKYEVPFGIPKAAEKWKHAVFVFGKPGEYAAMVYPADDPAKYDFPEKASAVLSSAPEQTAQTSFAVDLIHPSRAILLVDDAWQRNAECLQVKVSVTSEVTDPALKAYFYGADGKLLHTERNPSRETDSAGNQVKPLKHLEKGKKYEVYFGISAKAAKWKRAVVVFGQPGNYAAKVYPQDDLAKFDFPENAIATSTQPTVSAAQNPSNPIQEKPVPELEALRAPFDAKVKQEVQQIYDAGVVDLNTRYIAALDRAQETAQKSGNLDDALAIKSDKEAVALGSGVPATDDETTRPVLKQLRGTYRVAIGRLDTERARRLQPLQASFARALDGLVVSLTKEGKLDEAMTVKRQRDALTAPAAAEAPTVLGQLAVAPGQVPAATIQIPELWTWHRERNLGPSGTILFKKDGTVEQKINDRQNSTFGSWKATGVNGVLSVTLGDETCVMTIAGSEAVFDASFGRRYLKVKTTAPPTTGITDLRTQLAGTTWKADPAKPKRPGLAETLTFTDKSVEPGGYRYEAEQSTSMTITFARGDKQVMTLAKSGTRLQFSFHDIDGAYELVPK